MTASMTESNSPATGHPGLPPATRYCASPILDTPYSTLSHTTFALLHRPQADLHLARYLCLPGQLINRSTNVASLVLRASGPLVCLPCPRVTVPTCPLAAIVAAIRGRRCRATLPSPPRRHRSPTCWRQRQNSGGRSRRRSAIFRPPTAPAPRRRCPGR